MYRVASTHDIAERKKKGSLEELARAAGIEPIPLDIVRKYKRKMQGKKLAERAFEYVLFTSFFLVLVGSMLYVGTDWFANIWHQSLNISLHPGILFGLLGVFSGCVIYPAMFLTPHWYRWKVIKLRRTPSGASILLLPCNREVTLPNHLDDIDVYLQGMPPVTMFLETLDEDPLLSIKHQGLKGVFTKPVYIGAWGCPGLFD